MPGKKHRNPFEDHINSESFDVSNLGSVHERSPMEQEMDEFFDSLSSEAGHDLWDNELDDRQKEISAYLATELAERIMRQQHGELVDDFSDAELISLMTVPVTLAMIAEQRLHQIEEEKEEHPLASTEYEPYGDKYAVLTKEWSYRLGDWLLRARNFLRNLFRRH